MKKLLVVAAGLVMLGMFGPLYAADAVLPKLKMKITNTVKNQHLALCLAENCYDIANTNEISLEAGDIDSIVMANMENMQMYAQMLPPSCKVTLKENQLLTVTGTVVAQNASFVLNNLNCSVTG